MAMNQEIQRSTRATRLFLSLLSVVGHTRRSGTSNWSHSFRLLESRLIAMPLLLQLPILAQVVLLFLKVWYVTMREVSRFAIWNMTFTRRWQYNKFAELLPKLKGDGMLIVSRSRIALDVLRLERQVLLLS